MCRMGFINVAWGFINVAEDLYKCHVNVAWVYKSRWGFINVAISSQNGHTKVVL